MLIHHSKMPHQPADYRKLQEGVAFVPKSVAAIRKRTAESTNGR